MSSDEPKTLDKISPLINSQMPEFIRVNHPSFVAFLNAYYEWLETQGAYLRNPMDLTKVKDIDTTFEEYVQHFKKQYLLDFPESLAINLETGKPVEVKTLIKHIKQFYRAKGTEKTFEFLFRILYDTNTEFYYPKVDILKASDGKWIQKKAIRVSGVNSEKIFECVGQRIFQRDSDGDVSAAATVVEVTKFRIGSFQIYELVLSNINRTFYANKPIEFSINNQIYIEPKPYSVVSSISITSGGVNYRKGDVVLFTNAAGDNGQTARAKVSEVDSKGKILKISLLDSGINYNALPTISVSSLKGTGFSGTCTIGPICNFSGYYANNDGKLNSDKVIQDSNYYQNYSYVLKTEVVFDRYRDIIKRLIHPAGLEFFGQILIKRCAESNLDSESAILSYEVPLIGHYIPYTNSTFDDLRVWFGGTASSYDPTIHDPIIENEPNPVTNEVDFVRPQIVFQNPGFPAADPWWIIYQHPNRRIKDKVVARIEYDLKGTVGPSTTGAGKSDFLNGSTGSTSWNEWCLTASSARNSWASSFTGGYKYAILKYNSRSEFRKITMNSFFTMPIGEEFNCLYDWASQVKHGNPNELQSDTICYNQSITLTFAFPGISGCTSITANNYNPDATVDDGSCVYSLIFGCMDSNAINYNQYANYDNGSCIYRVLGCTDPIALNFNPLANVDDNSCTYENSQTGNNSAGTITNNPPILGCMDPNANNYNPRATINDGSCVYSNADFGIRGCKDTNARNYNIEATVRDDTLCEYDPIPNGGCMDILATNYNPSATYNDGSCVYKDATIGLRGCKDRAAVNYNPEATIEDNSLCTYDTPRGGCMDQSAINYDPQAEIENGSCVYISPTEGIKGCKNPRALNYDPEATIRDDRLCIYANQGRGGCKDPSAINFDATADYDNGACLYTDRVRIYGCTDPNAINYNPNATHEDGSCSYVTITRIDTSS